MSLSAWAREKLRAVAGAYSRDRAAAPAEEGAGLPFGEAKAIGDAPETARAAFTAPNAALSDEQLETAVAGIGWSYSEMFDNYERLNAMRRRTGSPVH